MSPPPSTPSPRPSDPIVGIDLGTTNSLVAVCDERGPRIIPDAAGHALLPSVVRYEADESQGGVRTVVGREAKQSASTFPRQTVTSVKRLMGRSSRDAQRDAAYLSYEVVPGERDTARANLWLGDQPGSRRLLLSPEEVSAQILLKLQQQASTALGQDVRRAVVTVPAYFDDAQRQATRTAGRLAGLDVVRIVPEPTAAALAYGLGLPRSQATSAPSTVAVYDLGGGTFDISILKLTPGQNESDRTFFQVLSTAGDTHLGGDDIDHLLLELFRTEIAQTLRAPDPAQLELPPGTRRQLAALAEAVKCRLSEHETASVSIDLGSGQAYDRTVTRAELEKMIEPLVAKTIQACRQALSDAKRALPPEGVGAVVMVGGSTRIPLVRQRVGEFFGLPPYTALDPDQVVALGAAVQASVLAGRSTAALLLDVIPLSLGIETVGGAVAKLIMRNSTVPARASERFSTSVDGQTSIRFSVYQGEREMAADCRRLGEFHLRAVPPMPAGIPQIEVEFLVDANGVLNVSALERRSGKRAALQVVPNYGLTAEEVEAIERDSYAHAREDMSRHRVVDLIANSKLDLKWIGERVARYGNELPPDNHSELLARIEALQALVTQAEGDWKSVNPDALHSAKDALDRASVRLQEVGIARSLAADQGR